MTFRELFPVVMTITVLALAAGKLEARMISFPSEGFSLELSEQWVKVPTEVFEAKMQELKKAYGGKSGKNIAYRHALQLRSKEWFNYPYILVNRWDDTRVESDEIPDMNERLKEHLLKEGNGISGTRLKRSSFDPDSRIYQAKLRFELAKRDMVMIKTVCYMNQSVLVLNAYIPEKSYPDYGPEVASAMSNLRLDPANVYQAGASSGMDFRKDILPYLKISIATGIILLLVGLFLWKRRRSSGNG
jgi:hypothetical protein